MDGRLLDDVFNKVAQDNNELIQIWLKHIVFSWRWWFAVFLTFIPWIIWVKVRDKENTIKLLLVGFVVVLTTDSLDIIGLAFHLWHYDWTLLPFIPEFIPWDYTLFPVTVMIMFQVKPKANVFIKALIFGVTSAFVVEPLFYWLDMYDKVHWSFWYSFIIYVPLYLGFNFIYERTRPTGKQ